MNVFVKGSWKHILVTAALKGGTAFIAFSPFVAAGAFAEGFAVVVPAAASASRSVVTQRDVFAKPEKNRADHPASSRAADETAAFSRGKDVPGKQKSAETTPVESVAAAR
jgi:hypothetical protein